MDEERRYHIEFQPLGIRGEISSEQSLLECARELQLDLISVCGGAGTCGKCRIRVIKGAVSELQNEEQDALSRDEIQRGFRLACRTYAKENLLIEIPAESLSAPQRLQVEGSIGPIRVDPIVRKVDVSLTAPSLSDAEGDDERLYQGLEGQHGVLCTAIDRGLLSSLSSVMRKNDWHVSAKVRASEVISVSSRGNRSMGVAIDLGTTKIAGYLVDLETGQTLAAKGVANPQISYGEDVIARMNRALVSSKDALALQTLVVDSLNTLCKELCQQIPDATPSDIDEFVIVGNTAMHHLVLRLPIEQLVGAPYIPAVKRAMDVKARDLGLVAATGAYVHFVPNVGGFVGGDHLAMLLATKPWETRGPVLALDIGTNTEVSVIADGQISALACASGPAFEGAHISCGVRAASGAIDHVRIEGEKLNYHTIQNREPIGICGSGVFDILAQLFINGIINRNGRLEAGHPRVRVRDSRREFVVVGEDERKGGPAITVTQDDIRELQLAKAAIQAGVTILLKEKGLSHQDVEKVILAGAFGTYLDISSIIAIGMLRAIPMERYRQIGNAAGAGARAALVSARERAEVTRLAKHVRYIELATVAEFNKTFIEAIAIGQEV
jgi:uncharacterized 2Fe-2S/4Fe-4S cluster protein (DUF4445 family)